jgi:hypothetical protein
MRHLTHRGLEDRSELFALLAETCPPVSCRRSGSADSAIVAAGFAPRMTLEIRGNANPSDLAELARIGRYRRGYPCAALGQC